MKRILNKLIKKPRVPRSPKVNKPWASGGSSRSSGGDNKTMMGMAADTPFIDGSRGGQSGNMSCPRCGYPLLAPPSVATPCPSCEFQGEGAAPASSGQKTMNISSLDYNQPSAPSEKHTSLKFELVDESTNEIIQIETEENELVLCREHLDPNNSSISSESHIKFSLVNGDILVTDVSTNQASFIQAKEKTPVPANCRIILGNKILQNLSGSAPTPPPANSGATQRFGEFDLQGGVPSVPRSLELKDERTQQVLSFQGTSIVVNRQLIDPQNPSISGTQHAVFELHGATWYITDTSSNQATFVQLTGDKVIRNDTKLVLGNKIFRYVSQ